MSPISEARKRANAKYNAKAYDRIELKIPKGQKATVQAAADREGESINGFTNKALLARIGLEEWPEAPNSDTSEKDIV